MRSFLHPQRSNNIDDEDYIDPDIVEPVFFPETVEVVDVDEEEEVDDDDEDEGEEVNDEEDDEVNDEDSGVIANVPVAVSEATQLILTGLMEETNHLHPTTTTANNPPQHNGEAVAQPASDRTSGVAFAGASASQMHDASGMGETVQAIMSGEDTDEDPRSLINKRHCESPPALEICDTKRPLVTPLEEEESSQGCVSVSEEAPYSNPLASVEETEGIDDEAFRGDRIGETTYSERHILKILMKWIEELPRYSRNPSKVSETVVSVPNVSDPTDAENEDCEETKLERAFKKEMCLLWDMSSEPDVMTYLVDKGIFGIIHDSLLSSTCERLTEISLGILANTLSSPDMTSKLAAEDELLKMIETVISVGSGTSEVAILVQVFAVLRRITWYMHHVAPVETWISNTLASPPFLNMLTLILKGSTHVPLLEDAVMVAFFLLEVLLKTVEETSNSSETVDERVLSLASESVVTSLCEGIEELLKGRDNEETGMRDLIAEIKIVPHHTQLAIRSGLGALCFIQKIPLGQETLRNEKVAVAKLLTGFFTDFCALTTDLEREQALEYLVAGMNLLLFCQLEYSELHQETLLISVTAAKKLMEEETDEGLLGSLYLSLHEHLTQLGRKFGLECVLAATDANSTCRSFLDPIIPAIRKTIAADLNEELGTVTQPNLAS